MNWLVRQGKERKEWANGMKISLQHVNIERRFRTFQIEHASSS